jgi:hypothetical protein
MTAEQFRLLNEMEQLSAILQFGKLMAQNVESECRVFLYRMESFYVSATYNNDNDQLSEITCFIEIEQAIPHFRKKLISINPAEREFNLPGL